MALRLSRPVKAVLATGIAASSIAVAGLPAAAATTSVRASDWWMSALSIRASWPVSRGAGITIAVLNDGVDTQQPDLTGATVTTGPDYTGTDQSSGQYFGEVGTGVAALIAGHGYGLDSQSGMLGEVPLARLLSIRVTLPANDPQLAESTVAAGLPDAIASGIRYAVAHGASVIDLPIDPAEAGPAGSGGASAAAGGSAKEAAAVKYALSRNVVLVAPAGDDNLAADARNYPAAYPGVIAVGAFDKNFVKAPWTSHQSYVTVTAAGSGMLLPTNTGTFRPVSSTTYASAVVAGIAAMMQGRFPRITVAQVRKALITGTVFHGAGGHANGSGYGTVNAAHALSAAATELARPATLAGSGTQPLTAQASPAHQAAHQPLAHTVIRDAIVCAALLVVLLLLIALYAAAGRRRASRRRAAAPADWSRPPRSRYPGAAATPAADGMLEYFTAPVAAPATPARPVPVRVARPTPADGVFAAIGRPAPIGRDPFASRPVPPPEVPVEATDRSPLGPASKAVTKRPSVAGAPPWEEASQPPGELPWSRPAATRGLAAAAPGRHSGPPADDWSQAAPAAALPTRPGGLWERATHARPDDPGQPDFPPAESRQVPDFPSAPEPRQIPDFPPVPDFAGSDFRLDSSARPGPALPQRSDLPQGTGLPQRPELPKRAELRPAAAYQPDAYQPEAYEPDAYRPDAYPAATGQLGERSSEPQFSQPGRRSPDRPGQSLTGRLNWSQGPTPDAPPSDPPFPPAAPRGIAFPPPDAQRTPPPEAQRIEAQRSDNPLPVRQPRTAAPPPALSPSGSLWERAVDPKPAQADSETGGRPIFGWNSGATAESVPAEPTELGPRLDWGMLRRQDRPSDASRD